MILPSIRLLYILKLLIIIGIIVCWYMTKDQCWQKSVNNFTASNSERSNSSVFVALSVNNDVRYAYLLPFVIEGWLRCGIQPIFVLIGDEEIWRHDNHSSIVLRYLHERKGIVEHIRNRSLIDKYTSNILSRTSRLSVPHILNKIGISLDSILLMGDADVIPLKCDYFKSIPNVMKNRNVQVYMDGPWDLSIPRYLMCYIAAYLSSWNNITEKGSSIEQVMENTLQISNVQMAYNNPNRTIPEYDFDEHFVGRRIKKLECFPNCTTHNQISVRDYEKEKRGPGRPPYNWTEAFGKNSLETLHFLGTLTEAHSGTGIHSFYGKDAWPILHGLISIYMERETVNRLSIFANAFFKVNN